MLFRSLLHKEDENTYDPHVWFNTKFWAIQAKSVADKLSEILPESKDYFENNLQVYLKSLRRRNRDELHGNGNGQGQDDRRSAQDNQQGRRRGAGRLAAPETALFSPRRGGVEGGDRQLSPAQERLCAGAGL